MSILENDSEIEKMNEHELRSMYCQLFNEVAIRKQAADEYARILVVLKKVEVFLYRCRF